MHRTVPPTLSAQEVVAGGIFCSEGLSLASDQLRAQWSDLSWHQYEKELTMVVLSL